MIASFDYIRILGEKKKKKEKKKLHMINILFLANFCTVATKCLGFELAKFGYMSERKIFKIQESCYILTTRNFHGFLADLMMPRLFFFLN